MNEQQQEQPQAPDNADELAALTAEAADIEPGYGADGAPVEPEPEAPELGNADAIKMLLGPAMVIMAPRWQVQPAEVEQLAIAWGEVADKYMPDGLAIGVELNAAIITLAILGPRLTMPRTDAEAAKRDKGKTGKRQQQQAQQHAADAAKAAEAQPLGESRPIVDLTQGADDAATE